VVASALSRLEHAQGGHKDLDMGTRADKISFDMGGCLSGGWRRERACVLGACP
jgi:hypothetical protein